MRKMKLVLKTLARADFEKNKGSDDEEGNANYMKTMLTKS